MYDYKDLVLESLYKNEIIDDELYEKCQPKYISSLPGDLRSTDVDELQSRLDAIDEGIADQDMLIDSLKDSQDELDKYIKEQEENIRYNNKQLDDLKAKEDKFFDLDKKAQEDAFDLISDIQDRFREVFDGYELGQATINGRPNPAYVEIGSLAEFFEFGSLLASYDVANMEMTANRLVDFAYEQTGGDDTAWSNRAIGIADDLRYLANKNDVNNKSNPVAQALDDISSANELRDTVNGNINDANSNISNANIDKDSLKKKQDQAENKKNKLSDEKIKTQSRLDEVKKND